MNKSSILMIDDDGFFLKTYTSLLGDEYDVHGAADISSGLSLIDKVHPAVLLLDISLTTEKEGLAVLPQLKKQFPHLPIIIVTNWDSYLISKEAILLGADDFFVKSDNLTTLKITINNLLIKDQSDKRDRSEFLVAESPAFRQVLREAEKAARSLCSVLISGESGVGKEVVARHIHQHSQRCRGRFYAINCGAIPESLLESELFGHEKGAFTGALWKKIGKFEMANGGTLLLDEVEELSPHAQAALLRAIQEHEIEHLGSTQKIHIDVRFIAATKSDLWELTVAGKFREDLYYRLAVYSLHIPPLRQREEDIIPLCHFFLKRLQEKRQVGNKRFTQSTLLMLKTYHWPGNVRELENVIERAVIRCEGHEIRPADLVLQHVSEKSVHFQYDAAKASAVRNFQREHIKEALSRNRGNVSLTAKEIGISRQQLSKIMRDLHLDSNTRAEN